MQNTVNQEFLRGLYFRENKIIAKIRNHSLSFTDIDKSRPSRDFLKL